MNNHIPFDISESNRVKDLLVQLSDENTDNILEELMILGDRPEVLSILIYKLAQERTKTNQMFQELNDKYNRILGLLSESSTSPPSVDPEFLPDQDQSIIDLIRKKYKITARDVKEVLSYKGLNAASQRLNKLYKDGLLDKKRVGQKVFYMIK